jgi:Ulp1 protease family, C-terminal catalytic domain
MLNYQSIITILNYHGDHWFTLQIFPHKKKFVFMDSLPSYTRKSGMDKVAKVIPYVYTVVESYAYLKPRSFAEYYNSLAVGYKKQNKCQGNRVP